MCKLLVVLLFFVSVLAADNSKPNIVIIMADDVGYSDIGSFGGEIKTPHLDSLADNGLRFTNFYSENMCWVSRACMLTGSYHKASLQNKGIHPAAVTLPELLKTKGYKTFLTGKWHLESKRFPSPLDRGFDHFYGTPGGAASFFAPYNLTRDRKIINEEYDDPDYYFTDAISDNAAKWIKETDKDTPVFINVAYTAAHWPLHAFDEDIEKYKGKYAMGWDKIREQRLKRMKAIGIVDETVELSPRHEKVKAWEETPNKEWEQRRMEVYAAQLTVMDEGIGRMIQALKDSGRFENTLIFFTIDNGGCHVEFDKDRKGSFLPKQTRDGKPMTPGNLSGVMPGPENTYQSYGYGWANMSNTPYRYFKQYGFEGGIRTPMIAHWPAAIKAKGKLVKSPTHLVDLMPSIMDIVGVELPEKSFEKSSMPQDGSSVKQTLLEPEKIRTATPLFFDHAKGRALRLGDWKIVLSKEKVASKDWQLYNLTQDPVEVNDLAKINPEKLQQLINEWQRLSQLMNKKQAM